MTEEREFIEKTEMFEALDNAGFATDRIKITHGEKTSTIEPAYTAENLINDGWLKGGTKVKFLDENGYDINRKYATDRGMKKGDIFTIKKTYIGDWSSDYEFEEIDGRYNTVMFNVVQ